MEVNYSFSNKIQMLKKCSILIFVSNNAKWKGTLKILTKMS